MSAEDTTNRLIEELLDAKTWPARLKGRLEDGVDIGVEIGEAEKKIKDLEERAKAAMKTLGCVSPQTRTIYHTMADMLINWHAFKDTLT